MEKIVDLLREQNNNQHEEILKMKSEITYQKEEIKQINYKNRALRWL